LIVTCQNCDTSFQLDESRVPPKGIRVRCSRCKEAFFLPHPSASAADAVHEVAGDAATTGGTVAPNVTQDLPPTAALGQGASEEDEHDWEFNVDPNPPVPIHRTLELQIFSWPSMPTSGKSKWRL
jgi:predicted Zn finger-like uncharacterized protein